MYSIIVSNSAEKDMSRLDRPVLKRIAVAIDGLAENPRPNGCIKLKGSEDFWRIRVGDYRVIYTIADEIEIVDVRRVRHRREVYE